MVAVKNTIPFLTNETKCKKIETKKRTKFSPSKIENLFKDDTLIILNSI